MGKYEIDDDFVINDTLKPHVNDNFRVTSYPGAPLFHDPSGRAVYPTLLTTGSGNAIHLPFLFDKLISLTGKPKPNVVYIGTPFFDREDKYESGTESFRRLGCRLKRLMVAKECTTPSFDEMRRIVLEWPDLIIISGGNSLFAMLRWQSIGLDLLLREAAGQGKVLSGGSAGCGCYFDTMQTDSLKPEACKLSERVLAELSAEQRLNWSFVRITCLGFINAFCVPHIDAVGTNKIARVEIAKKMLLEAHSANMDNPISEERKPVFGLGVDEKAAVIYQEGKLSFYSAGKRCGGIGEATCHILFVHSHNGLNEVMVIPMPPNTGEAMTMDGWIERAMRSVVALNSPLDLIVSSELSVSDACHRRGCSGFVDLVLAAEDLGVTVAPPPEAPYDKLPMSPLSPAMVRTPLPPVAERKVANNAKKVDPLPLLRRNTNPNHNRQPSSVHVRRPSLDSFVGTLLPPSLPRPASAHCRSRSLMPHGLIPNRPTSAHERSKTLVTF